MALTGLTNLQPLHIKTVGIGTFDNTVSVGGTLTYEDVTNVDAIGIITARSGLKVTGGQLDVGSNIKLGNAGVVTATSFVGSGSGLTGLPAQATIANNADNRVITGGSGVNLNGEANLTFNGTRLDIAGSAQNQLQLNSTHSDGPNIVFERSSSALGYLGSAAANTGGTATDLALRAQNNLLFASNGGNERLRIGAGGTVSISQSDHAGAQTLGADLVVADTTGASIIVGDTGSGEYLRLEGGAGLGRIGTKSNHDLVFHTNGISNERLRIASDGKITVAAGSDIRFTNGTWTGEVAGKIQHNSNNLYIQGGSGGIRFRHHSNGSNQFSMTNGGNFEIANGDLVVASGHGIDFSATSNSSGSNISELLDDYEEGSWTPAWNFSSSNYGPVYTHQQGAYTKIGRQVTVYFSIYSTSVNGSTGSIRIGGLPFTDSTSPVSYPATAGAFPIFGFNGWTGEYIALQVVNGLIELYGVVKSTTSYDSISHSEVNGGGALYLKGQVTYNV